MPGHYGVMKKVKKSVKKVSMPKKVKEELKKVIGMLPKDPKNIMAKINMLKKKIKPVMPKKK